MKYLSLGSAKFHSSVVT